MAVHPKGRTGNEGHIVLALHDRQQGRVAGQNYVDLINRIGQCLVQDMDKERISFNQLIQIGKHFFRGKPAVAGEDGMGTFAAHGKGCADHMADLLIQRIGLGAVSDGHIDTQLWNVYVCHDPIPVDVQKFRIALHGGIDIAVGKGRVILDHAVGDHDVVFLRGFPCSFQL